MIATTRPETSVREPLLFVAFELSHKQWTLALSAGCGVEPWVTTVPSRDWRAVERVVTQARARFGLARSARVVSCYEAGRDGFWIDRALAGLAVRNRVIDSASIEVDRRARRAKTDRLDARKLVRMLIRVRTGERDVWREVCVPTVAQEAARHVSRERTALTQEQTRLINQMRGWLTTWGASWPARRGAGWWTTVCDWAGAALPAAVQARLARADARLQLLQDHIATLERQQQTAVQAGAGSAAAVRQLTRLKGVATTGASVLVDEGVVWRAFRNRREIGGLLGFTPTPYASGAVAHEQGISRAGNARLQSVAVQLAWSWIRWQPESALTQWYVTRFGQGTRARRIGIVAVARKLLIALWRWVTLEVKPAGAILKTA